MMKKTFYVLLCTTIFAMCMISCSHQRIGKTVTKTVDASLQVNESYRFTLPQNVSKDDYVITTQATHSLVSMLERDNATRTVTYLYTPATDYTGTDMVVISTPETPRNPTMGCGNGNSSHDYEEEEDETKITINLTILSNTTVVTVKK